MTSDACEPVSLIALQLFLEVIDTANQDWEDRRIIGKEGVNAVLHYVVEWSPTIEPEHLLGHSIELVDEFEAQLRVQRGVNGKGWLS